MKRPVAYHAGIGKYAPRRVIRNQEFAKMGLDTSDEWIVQRTGIKERHIAGPNETNCSMSALAARSAMERAGVHAGELDVIIVGTASPDRLLPSTAVDLQAELGATRAAAFDVAAACSSWLYGLIVAEGLIMNGSAETALVVGTEKLSAITDWTDRSTAVLFGDGSGAAILKRSKQH
jgi:3-oxoacyl-[acyl-carrier-protein] synthase-3